MDKQELKSLVTAFGELITAAAKLDSDKDGKIELTEIFSFVQTLVMKVAGVYGSFPEAIKQLNDVTSEERTEFIDTFASEFELSNDDAEELIEEWLYMVDDLLDAIKATKKFIG
jgi:hypothetical protein